MKEVIVVDNHPVVLAALSSILSPSFSDTYIRCIASGYALKEFLNEAGSTAEKKQVLIAFVDLNLPDADGVEAIQSLHTHFNIPVIAMSGYTDLEKIRRCAQSGAAGFIEKSSNIGIYPAVANLVLSGGTFFPSEFAKKGELPLSEGNQQARLTARQKEVLDLLTHGMPNKIIAATLGLSEGTVKNHVGALLDTFKVKSRSQLILATMKPSSSFNERL